MIPRYAQSHKKHIVVLVSIGAIIAGLIVGYIVLYRLLGVDSSELQETLSEINSRTARIGYLESLRRGVEETTGERTRLDTYFLGEKSVAGFLTSVEAMGGAMGLNVETVRLGVQGTILRIGVSAKGPFETIGQFMALIEKLPYKLRISQVDLQKEPSGVQWSADFELDVISFAN